MMLNPLSRTLFVFGLGIALVSIPISTVQMIGAFMLIAGIISMARKRK